MVDEDGRSVLRPKSRGKMSDRYLKPGAVRGGHLLRLGRWRLQWGARCWARGRARGRRAALRTDTNADGRV